MILSKADYMRGELSLNWQDEIKNLYVNDTQLIQVRVHSK